MVSLVWSNKAKEDLKSIYDFISLDSIKFAKLQIKNIRQFTQILKIQPKIGRVVPSQNKKYIREIIQGNYRIIYSIKDPHQLVILTIHHSSKLLKIKNIMN